MPKPAYFWATFWAIANAAAALGAVYFSICTHSLLLLVLGLLNACTATFCTLIAMEEYN